MWSRLRQLWFQTRPTDAGTQGEQLALAYLQHECRYVSLARNWRNPADQREEIDLVMRDGKTLVFVEVKARSARALIPGYFAVTQRKKDALRRACRAYLNRLDMRPQTIRFDVVEVVLPAGGSKAPPIIRHFPHVPLFTKHFR